MLRLRDCPRCGGDMIVQYGEDGCLQCGYENVDVAIVEVAEEHVGLWRGRTAKGVEVLGVGVQCRSDNSGVSSWERSRYFDDMRSTMEGEFAEVCRARASDLSLAGRLRASKLYAEFLERHNITWVRWCKLQKRWHRETVTA